MKKIFLIGLLLVAALTTTLSVNAQDRVTQIYTETTTNLGNGGAYTGAARDTKATLSSTSSTAVKAKSQEGAEFKTIVVTAIADQASAANGLKLQVSNDNSTWYTVAQSALVANTPNQLTAPLVARYYRVTLTNGATPQTSVFVASALQK
jgi:hypothetical protein